MKLQGKYCQSRRQTAISVTPLKKLVQTAKVYVEIILTPDQVQVWNSVAKIVFFSLLPGLTFNFPKAH